MIDFTAGLFGLSTKDAAEKLITDFGMDASEKTKQFHSPLEKNAEQFPDRERLCIRVFRDYLRLLNIWSVKYRPESSEELFHDRFVEAVTYLPEANHILDCLLSNETIISAVVHMDEKTPYMHLPFVPLTQDRRLSAKEILGNKKNLTKWQDEYWKHMVSFYPDLERGESASETGRTHILPRIFKQAFRLSRQKEKLMALLGEITPFNVGKKSAEIEKPLQTYIPDAEKMRTAMKKYEGAFKAMKAENAVLEKKVDSLTPSIHQQLEEAQQMQELAELRQVVDGIPEEVLQQYRTMKRASEKETEK